MDLKSDVESRLQLVTSTYPSTIWLFDVDDTLTDTAAMHRSAEPTVAASLSKSIDPEVARNIASRFISIFDDLLAVHQATTSTALNAASEPLRKLQGRVQSCQKDIQQRWRITKPFSREILLKIACEDFGILIEPFRLAKIADDYWQYVSDNIQFIEDALELAKALAINQTPLYLITSSDARFQLKGNGQFDYDPEYSRRFKHNRLSKLRKHGVMFRDAIIGDPIDKPDTRYYDSVFSAIEKDLGRTVSPQNVVVVGDSYRSDIETLETEKRLGLGLYFRRGKKAYVKSDTVVAIGNLGPVTELVNDLPLTPNVHH